MITCPMRTILTGGGYNPAHGSLNVIQNGPVGSETWIVGATNSNTNPIELTVTAMCLPN